MSTDRTKYDFLLVLSLSCLSINSLNKQFLKSDATVENDN